MAKKENIPEKQEALRLQAEEKIIAPTGHMDKQTAQVFYELRVHQIELEMQNEELRRTQQELEASRACYFDLYNLAPVGYCTLDRSGVILEANLTAATQLGVARGELVNQSISRFIYPDDQDINSQHCKLLFETGLPQACELRLIRPDATSFWARLEINLAHSADGLPLCRVVISDITAIKQMEESLRQSAVKFRTVADFTYDWEYWLGPDGDFLYCSPSCQKVTGHSVAVFEHDPSLLRALIHPDDLAAYDQHCHAAREQRLAQELEFRIIRADGSIRWQWISHVCQPVYDDNGKFLGTRGSCRDITERKLLEAEVIKDRNLASLGVLAGGIAHDFNNLFQGLFGNLALAKMNIEKSSKAYPFLQNAENVFDAATRLTSQLIAFSTGGISILITIQPAPHIKQEVVACMAGSDLAVEFYFADNLWSINVDPNQFREVIKQMVWNAKDAMHSISRGKLKIVATNEVVQESGHGACPPLAPGNYVKISIKDQGCGIKSNHLSSIFDPYFSTKQPGCQKGMGLGLALCDTIVRKHGGAIVVNTKPDKGSTFHIYIPAVVSVARKVEKVTDQDDQGRGPRILIMDDNATIVQVTTNFLKISGFRVDAVADGDEAVKAVTEAYSVSDPYVVVILDLTIPGGKGGKEVVSVLRTIDPGVKTMVSSGYTSDEAMIDFANYGFDAACAKPYLLAELKEQVERLLSERQG